MYEKNAMSKKFREDRNMNGETMDKSIERERKGKRLWKKVRHQLVEYHSLPGYLKDNEYIVGHYRSELPMKQILLSIFSIHNETLNVWTHLIGFFLFLSLTICHIPADWYVGELLSNCLPERFFTRNHSSVCVLHSVKDGVTNIIAPVTVRPITRWPFFAFLGGAMFCFLASSACHLLSCHSERISFIVRRLDYAGIAALISTSFYPPVYYTFMCEPFYRNLYMGFISLLGVATIFFTFSPGFHRPEFRPIRASLFFGMGMSGVGPILHKLSLFWHQHEAVLHTTCYEVLMGILYGVGALVYATRVPERWMPGKFDVVGNSHQLFHIFVVAGAYVHYRSGLVYLKWRDEHGC